MHVGGVLFADDVHDCHCLNETLQENRESHQSGRSQNSQSFSPASVYLQLSVGLHHFSSGDLPEKEVQVKL